MLKRSRLLVVFQLLTYGVLVSSVLNWQIEIFQFQHLLQALVLCCVSFFILRVVYDCCCQTHALVIFSSHGEWLESNINEQTDWKMTDKSRVTSLLLFIHLISSAEGRLSKWSLIYRDQVTEQDFRRLCCAVIYQQQNIGNQ